MEKWKNIIIGVTDINCFFSIQFVCPNNSTQQHEGRIIVKFIRIFLSSLSIETHPHHLLSRSVIWVNTSCNWNSSQCIVFIENEPYYRFKDANKYFLTFYGITFSYRTLIKSQPLMVLYRHLIRNSKKCHQIAWIHDLPLSLTLMSLILWIYALPPISPSPINGRP